jgi:hypothetical protein
VGLYDSSISQISTYFAALDINNYEVILIFQGSYAQTIDYSSQNIQKVINQITKNNTTATTNTQSI